MDSANQFKVNPIAALSLSLSLYRLLCSKVLQNVTLVHLIFVKGGEEKRESDYEGPYESTPSYSDN